MVTARVLIVEDELLVARDIKRCLEEFGHQVVGTASGAEEAVRLAGNAFPDLVLMDISLQGEPDGIVAASRIREKFNTPVVYLTSYDDEKTVERARATEPFAYLIKPFQERELHLAIQMAMYRHRASEELRKANRALKTLSGCNRAVSQAGTVQELLDETCRIIVEVGGYGLSWAGFVEGEAQGAVRPAAGARRDGGPGVFDMDLIDLVGRTPGESPVAEAVRTARPVSRRISGADFSSGDQGEEGRPRYSSCVCMPLVSEAVVFGVLVIYASEPGAFDADEFDLMAELAGNLSYGIASIRHREERVRAHELIRKSEEKYKNLVELTTDIIYQLDREGNVTFMNDSAYRTLEASPEEVVGHPLVKWVHPEDREATRRKLADVVAYGEDVFNFENRVVCSRGRRMHVLHNVKVLRDGEGRAVGAQGVARDFTKRKMAEEALEESEETLRTITGTAKDAIVMLDEEGAVSFWNPAAEDIFGYTYGEIVGKNLHHLLAPRKYLEAYVKGFGRFVEDGTGPAMGRTLELTARRKDGGEIPIELSLSSIQIRGRWHSVGVIRDIAERKDVEEQIRMHREELADLVEERTAALRKEVAERMKAESEARAGETMLRTLFEEALNPFMVTDEHGRFVDANRAAVEFLESSRGELLKGSVWSYLPAEKMDYIEPADSPAFDSKTLETEYRVNGRVKTLLLNIVPVTVSGRKLLFFIGQEITERKRLLAELVKAQKLESVGVLAGGIAHDFNNILTSILSNISLARLSAEPEWKAHRLLVGAEKASLRARDLTQQLLTFSKGGTPVKKTASLERLLRETAEFVLRGSNVRCDFRLPKDLWPVDIDEGQISQAVSNIIINADHSMPEGGAVTVSADNVLLGPNDVPGLEEGRYVRVSVEDRGTGISPKHLDKIFDPYFTTKNEGSGLGLSTTYSIIRNHGGYITVESALGVGSVFRFHLPASEHEMESLADVAEKVHPGKGKILVMDDDEDIRLSVGEALKLFGYEVAFARDGQETIDLYQKEMDSGRGFDAIIMDLTIPGGMGGLEAVARLRQIDPDLKALVSSGYSNSPVMAEYRKYGFDGVITKPYRIEELSAVLSRVVSS